MKIFSGRSNKLLAEEIAKSLNLSLSPLEIHIFPDGEKRIRVIDRVVDENCIVVQPTSPPVDQNYMELFLIADGLKRSGAKSVSTVIPYFGYQRQDHIFRDGEAVSLDVIIKILQSIGIDKIIAFDFHSIRIIELFLIPIKHLSALPIFAEKIKEEGLNLEDIILIAPDMGAVRRIKIISEMLKMPYALICKNRDLETGEIEIEGLENSSLEIQGKIAKKAIIVDDMISSGKTVAKAADFLHEKGIEEVFVFATHAIFSDDAPKILSENNWIKKIFVTDTVFIPEEKKFDKLEILSVSEMIVSQLKVQS